jgi:hypothetical protein
MKKIILPLLCTIALAFTGCEVGDFGDDHAAPQQNDQEEAIVYPSSLTVTPNTPIDLNDYRGNSLSIGTLGSTTLPDSCTLGNYKVIINDTYSFDVDSDLTISSADLNTVIVELFGNELVGREVSAIVTADILGADEAIYLSSDSFTLTITPLEVIADSWGLIGVNGDWNNDVAMTEVAPGIWVSPMTSITSEGWKLRQNGGWDVNRGGATPSQAGEFTEAVPDGDNINLTGDLIVVYNANNETLGTMVWGVVGSIASIDGFSWNADLPMNLGADGKYYSIPFTATTSDQFKIRKNAGWDDNRGGSCSAVNAEFDAVSGGDNIVVPADGTYMLVYDPANETLTLSNEYWGLIGDFNSWGGDTFMMYDGAGKWAAYNQSLTGGWKIRQGSGWDNNRGGVYSTAGEAFTAVSGGDNITVSDLSSFDVIYDASAETITIE